jgi:hypothetical protein
MVLKEQREHLKRAWLLGQRRTHGLEVLIQWHEDDTLFRKHGRWPRRRRGSRVKEKGRVKAEEVYRVLVRRNWHRMWHSNLTTKQKIRRLTAASGTQDQLRLRWDQDAGENLRGIYGSCSRSTHKRERKKAERWNVRPVIISMNRICLLLCPWETLACPSPTMPMQAPLHGASWWPYDWLNTLKELAVMCFFCCSERREGISWYCWTGSFSEKDHGFNQKWEAIENSPNGRHHYNLGKLPSLPEDTAVSEGIVAWIEVRVEH